MQAAADATPHPDPQAVLRVVGLGASAGGLEALERFLKSVPARGGLAYLVVQHLDPTHKAMLAELLPRATPMLVAEARQGLRIEPDRVYVIPPNKVLTLAGDRLQLSLPEQPRGQRLPIDSLFESMARELGARAVGVVLSGMGADGSLGLKAIKAKGGLTLAQTPATAEFDAMPASAIQVGCVDVVAEPEQLVRHILLADHAVASSTFTAPLPVGELPEPMWPSEHAAADGKVELPVALQGILHMLKHLGKHDFSEYRTSTLGRRIERRMGVHGISNIPQYEELLKANPQEVELLSKELLTPSAANGVSPH